MHRSKRADDRVPIRSPWRGTTPRGSRRLCRLIGMGDPSRRRTKKTDAIEFRRLLSACDHGRCGDGAAAKADDLAPRHNHCCQRACRPAPRGVRRSAPAHHETRPRCDDAWHRGVRLRSVQAHRGLAVKPPTRPLRRLLRTAGSSGGGCTLAAPISEHPITSSP